jgi:hypothetical protein
MAAPKDNASVASIEASVASTEDGNGGGAGYLRCFAPVPIATRKTIRIGIQANRSYLARFYAIIWVTDNDGIDYPPVKNSISTE